MNPFLIVRKDKALEYTLGSSGKPEELVKLNESGAASNLNSENLKGKKKTREEARLQKKVKDSFRRGKKARVLIRITDLKKLSKQLNDKNMSFILDYMRGKNFALLERLLLGKTFASESEFLKYLKEEIIRFLESEVTLLKDRISDLRKHGHDVNDLSLRVMSVPLKIRIFSASFEKEDFQKIISLLGKYNQELDIKEKEAKSSDSIKKS